MSFLLALNYFNLNSSNFSIYFISVTCQGNISNFLLRFLSFIFYFISINQIIVLVNNINTDISTQNQTKKLAS